MKLHTNCRLALRTAIATVIKGQSVCPVTLAVDTAKSGLLTRTDGGSFVADGFSAGDEVTLANFGISTNNGRRFITGLTASLLELIPDVGGVEGFLPETPAGVVTVTAGLPAGQSDDGVTFQPRPGQPWFRETYKAGPETRQSIGPKARVRLDGLYMLSVFYPAGVGAHGLDGMTDALRTLLYPGAELSFGGQTLTVIACSRRGGIPEPEWQSAVLSVRFFAYAFNPQ
jgi:hypothetical protein